MAIKKNISLLLSSEVCLPIQKLNPKIFADLHTTLIIQKVMILSSRYRIGTAENIASNLIHKSFPICIFIQNERFCSCSSSSRCLCCLVILYNVFVFHTMMLLSYMMMMAMMTIINGRPWFHLQKIHRADWLTQKLRSVSASTFVFSCYTF